MRISKSLDEPIPNFTDRNLAERSREPQVVYSHRTHKEANWFRKWKFRTADRHLPILARATSTITAVIISAVLFALFHVPTNLAHWLSFTATGIAYGWMRVTSRSTTAAAFMHAHLSSSG